jgi:hypothetical protein
MDIFFTNQCTKMVKKEAWAWKISY